MKKLTCFAILTMGAALGVMVTAASAQMINDPGVSPYVPPSADVAVHQPADHSDNAKKSLNEKGAERGSREEGRAADPPKAEESGESGATAMRSKNDRAN